MVIRMKKYIIRTLENNNVPEFYSCYATKADCILNQVGNQLLYYGL